MRIILILLLRLSLSYCDKLDRTYLPPPGSTYSGGRTDDLKPPYVINQSPEIPKQNYVLDIKNGDNYNIPITKLTRDENVFEGPHDLYDGTYEERNLSSSNPPNENQKGQNKRPFTPTVPPSVTSSTISTGKPSYSQIKTDSFSNPTFRPESYNPETAQPGRFPSRQSQVTNNGRSNLEDKDSEKPQPDRFLNVSNQPYNNKLQSDGSERAVTDRFPSVPGQINDNRKYSSQTGDLNDFQGNYRQPSQTINLPKLSESPNVNNQYEMRINQKDQYSYINDYSPQSKAPEQSNNDQTSQPQYDFNRPQQKGQFNAGKIPYYQMNLNSPIDRPSYQSDISNLPSFNTSDDLLKPTSIFPSFSETYQPNNQNNTGNIYPKTITPTGSIISYPGPYNERLPAVYKRPERPQSALERNAVILDFKNILTPEGFEYSFDTSNGIHADEKGTALDGVKAEGSFSYTGDDGKYYEVVYSADENGFRPSGDHLPTSPPIPEAIQRVIEEAERNRDAGVVHDGFYDDKKYGHKKYDETPTRNKSRKPRPESDESNHSYNDDDQGNISDFNKEPKKDYYEDTNYKEILPERGYQTDRQNGKPNENYDSKSDDNEGVVMDHRPINQGTGQRQKDDRIPQYNQKEQQRKPSGVNTSGYAKNPNDYRYSQKQPSKIINQQFLENVPESGKKFINKVNYNRDDDQDKTSYPEQDGIFVYDNRDGEVKEISYNNRPVLSSKLDKPSQKNKETRPRTEIREKTRILSKKPQKNNDDLPSDDQYQTQRPESDSKFVNRQENINNYDDDSRGKGNDANDKAFDRQPSIDKAFDRQPSIDKKYFRNESDQQDYDFIEPDRITNENEDSANYYGKIGDLSKVPLSQRNKTEQEGYAYLPPNKQFYYKTTTLSTRKPAYQDIRTTQNVVNLDLEAPYTTQRPFTRYSTYRPSQNHPIATKDRPSAKKSSFDLTTEKTPYIQETNKRTFNKPDKIIKIHTFVETSTKPYNDQTRHSPEDQNYPYHKDTYQGTAQKQGLFQQKPTGITYGTTTLSPEIFKQTQKDQNYPVRPKNVGNDNNLQQQEIPKRAYETGYPSTTFRPKVRPGFTYEGKILDTQQFIPKTNQSPSNFKFLNQYVEPERYPTKERPGYNQYETPSEYQQTTTPNREDYIPKVTRLPSETPGFIPKQNQRPNDTKMTTTNSRYKITQRPNIPVKMTEDTTTSYGYSKYELSPNQPGKVFPNYSNETPDMQQDIVRRPAFKPTTFRPKVTDPSRIVQTTKTYPDSLENYPDKSKDNNKPYPQRINVFSTDGRPTQPSDLSTSAYPKSQNINYQETLNKFTPNQLIPRPSNTYPDLKPTQVQEIPGNVTQDISIDRARPGFNTKNNPNVGQDLTFSDGNQLQNYPQVKPEENRFDEPKKQSSGSFYTQNRPRIPGFQEKYSQDLPEKKLPENRPSIGDNVYPPNFDNGDFRGQNRDINRNYPSPAPEIIGDDFSGPKQPPRFDPKTGYHY